MKFESDKTMFEIYRERDFNKEFRLILYTELTENNKHTEINKALDGDTIFSGFINDIKKEEAKVTLSELVKEMNKSEEPLPEAEIHERLKEYLV